MHQSRDSISDIWGPRTPFVNEWPVRVDERFIDTCDHWVQSTCILCSNGCGLDIGVKDGRIVGVRGREVDRVNHGRLGPKGLHGWEANHSPDRLTQPLIRKDGKLVKASWDEAMDLITRRCRDIRDRYSSSAIGFYTSGQLFLEEYYTLGVIGKGGLGTPHMDGNTRLCTATAAASLMETFGSDGQPGSYEDIDCTDALFIVGHNVASQQTVLWSRMLDRLRGPRPPRLIVIDPRTTDTAKEAQVHLTPRIGTNIPLMNGLIGLIMEGGHLDHEFIQAHTTGFGDLQAMAAKWPAARVEQVTGIPEAKLREAADILGNTSSLLSTVLQGVYQGMQATAVAVQVNNLHLIRGLIGKPGCGILQMNGQPTAQNTRETGCDGALPAFRNWDNPAHIKDLARIWNVDPAIIPHWAPPTHAMQIFRYAEEGSLKMLWISGTNPAVSLPDLPRIRKILSKEGVFVITQDAFPTETTKLSDVVLPAAIWGEKTGTFTNVDRTVHISHKAVEPPGEARSDLDIFLDFGQRMDFRDLDGNPLIKWSTPEGAFEAWKDCTRGRFCDYSGLSYAKLSQGSGIPWPCNEAAPEGTVRIYTDGIFNTAAEKCETFGHDLATGAAVDPDAYKADDPKGRARIKAADYQPPHEEPDEEYPFWLITGRVVYHWHTRTKTARCTELQNAAPDAFVQISEDDATVLNVQPGDLLEVISRRGMARAPALIGNIGPGQVFMPFHYGYWDDPDRPRAANELTLFEWDPVSKQPHFKYAAVKVRKVEEPATAVPEAEEESIAERALKALEESIEKVKGLLHQKPAKAFKIADYIGLVHASEKNLADALTEIAEEHQKQVDVEQTCKLLASWSRSHLEKLQPFIEKYKEHREQEPEELRQALFQGPRTGGFGLLRDLHDLWLLTNEIHVSYLVLLQAAQGVRDKELTEFVKQADLETLRQLAWLLTRIKQAAPQALIVPK